MVRAGLLLDLIAVAVLVMAVYLVGARLFEP
jgi:hypothetical protein